MRFLTAAIVALSTVVFSSAQAKTIRNFKVGEWFAGAYASDSSGEFSHCAANARYKSGISVIFSINRNYHWSMSFVHPDWRLRPDAKFDIAFTVDDLKPIITTATAISSNHVVVPLANSAELFSQFRRGYVLRIAAAKQVFSFNLTGTSQLLPSLLTCTQNRGTIVRIASNPFESKTKNPTETTSDESSIVAEAAIFAANLLSNAGVTNFAMLEPNESPEIKGHARWFQGSTFGTINIYPKINGNDHSDLPGYLIGVDAKDCKGTFFSGAIPDESNAKVVRVFTTCQKGEKPITIYYLAVPRKAGGAYIISTISLGTEKPAKERDAQLRSAVFKTNGSGQSSLQN